MRNLTATLCLTLAVLLGSTGDSESSSETPYLTGEQIRALVSGNKMHFTTEGGNYHAVAEFEKDHGVNMVVDGRFFYFGEWNLSNNQICMDIEEGRWINCYRLTISGTTVKAYNKAWDHTGIWNFDEIPDAFASLLAEPAGKKKAIEEKQRQALAKKAAEEKKRRALAKKAAEEKKRLELPKRAAEQKSELPKTRKKPAKW